MTDLAVDRILGVAPGLAIKAPVTAATTANITLSGLQVIDGVTLTAGQRVLVWNQTTTTANGIYNADTGAWERARDFDGNRDAVTGTIVPVANGTLYGGYAFKLTTANPIVIGSSALTFTEALWSSSAGATFIQSGTGAVSRSAQTKMRDVLDLADFGVTGDGSDETTKVQAALNAAVSTGKRTVTAHGMTVCITTALTVDAALSFVFTGGAGFKAITPFVNSLGSDAVLHGIMVRVKNPNATFDGVVFDANNISANTMFCVWGDLAADYTWINRCTFKNIYYVAGACAVNYRFNNYSRVSHCTFLHCCAGPQTQGGRNIVFDDNDYISNLTGTRDTAFGMDGGISCQITNNRIQYENGAGVITSIIGVTSGASKFLVSGNTITGQNSGVGINIDKIGAAGVDTGIVSNNVFDGTSIAGLATYINIKMAAGSSGTLIAGNTFTAGATGVASSVCIQPTANGNVVRGNTINVSGVQAAILTVSNGGPLDIVDNWIQTSSKCVLVDSSSNSGKITWIKDNNFYLAAVAIDATGVTEANTPVYMQDNNFNDVDLTNPVQGTRWDIAFKAVNDTGHKPHYCGRYTVITSTTVPDGTWAIGGGTYKVGDQVWKADAASGGTPGWICTTAGVPGVGVFKAMANLA